MDLVQTTAVLNSCTKAVAKALRRHKVPKRVAALLAECSTETLRTILRTCGPDAVIIPRKPVAAETASYSKRKTS
jgi:hypothetical protein